MTGNSVSVWCRTLDTLSGNQNSTKISFGWSVTAASNASRIYASSDNSTCQHSSSSGTIAFLRPNLSSAASAMKTILLCYSCNFGGPINQNRICFRSARSFVDFWRAYRKTENFLSQLLRGLKRLKTLIVERVSFWPNTFGRDLSQGPCYSWWEPFAAAPDLCSRPGSLGRTSGRGGVYRRCCFGVSCYVTVQKIACRRNSRSHPFMAF